MILQIQSSVTKNTITNQHVLNSQVEDWSSVAANSTPKVKLAPKDEERPCKKARLFDSLEEMTILIAGREDHQKHFTIHKKIVCDASPFFKAHCKPEWMKHEEKVIKLPEDNAEVIQMLIFWIYHNQICISRKDCTESKTCEEALKAPWGLFAQLYVVAQKYQMSLLQNDAIDAILDVYVDDWCRFTPGLISWVYENTAEGDNLRKLIFRVARENLNRSRLATFCDNLCPRFLFDLAYAGAQSGSEGKLEDNEKLSSTEDPEDDFCVEYHYYDFGYGGKKCKTIKSSIEASDHDEDDFEMAFSILS